MKSTPALRVVAAARMLAGSALFFGRAANGGGQIAVVAGVGNALARAVFMFGPWWRTRAV